MKFVVDSKELEAVIKNMTKALGIFDTINVSADAKRLYLTAQASAKAASCVVPATVEKPGQFAIQTSTLLGVTKGRNKVAMSLEKDVLKFKAESSKNYAGELVTLPFSELVVETEKASLELKEDSLAQLNDLISLVSITDVNLGNANLLPICIKIGSKGTEISCASRHHMVLAVDKQLKLDKDAEFVLAPDVIPSLTALAKNTSYKLSITDASVFATNAHFKARLALQQQDRFVTLAQVKAVAKAMQDNKADTKIEASSNAISETLDNILSIYEDNAVIDVTCDGKKLKLACKTKYGSVSDAIDGECKGSAKGYSLHPKIVQDLMTKCKNTTLTLSLVGSKAMTLAFEKNTAKVFMSCSTV